jgi:hypothetical protein
VRVTVGAVLAATFPWDVAIVAVSTLTAGLGATWWSARTARANQFQSWRAEQQRAAAEQLLRAFSELYGALSVACKQPPGSTSLEADDWAVWGAAIERISLVGHPEIVTRVITLDREIWKLHQGIRMLDGLDKDEWLEFTFPVQAARADFVRAVRGVLGCEPGEIEHRGGKPDPDDPIWTEEYWQTRRENIAAASSDVPV